MDGTAASRVRPFIGLRPFAYEDRAYFFGREQQIERLLALLHDHRLVSVIGSSGSGKSSLIRAGLLPRLTVPRGAGRGWVECRPGEAPIRRLAEALAGPPESLAEEGAGDQPPDARADRIEMLLLESSFGLREALPLASPAADRPLVILVDQFEEIFRFADLRAQRALDPQLAAEQRDEATRFVQLLLTAAGDPGFGGRIVLTMRSDFIGDCARFHGLSEAVSESQYLVPALTRDQRAAAIRQPVESAGGSIEPALLQRLLNDSAEDPDQLPLLQHVMMRCWQRATSAGEGAPQLTLETYGAVGGFERALSLHAEEVLAELATQGEADAGPSLPEVTKRVFQALTDTDSGNRAIRRPQQLGDLVAVVTPDGAEAALAATARGAVRRVLARFADPDCSFLRVPDERELRDESVVDIGHEALIRRWDRLGSWLQEEQADRERLLDLARLARAGSLVAADRLPEYERWWQERRPNQAWAHRYALAEEDPVAAAGEVLRRSRAKLEKRARDSRRNRRRLQGLAAAVALLLVLLGVTFYLQSLEEAERAMEQARTANEARSRLVAVIGADALDREGADKALLIALHGLQGSDALVYVPELEALAYRALQAPLPSGLLTLQARPAVAFLADGKLVSLDGNRLRYWDATTLERLRGEIQLPKSGINLSTNRVDARVLVSGFDWAALYSAAGSSSGEPNFHDFGEGGARGVFSPDGRLVLTGSFSISPKLWGVGGGTVELLHDFAADTPALPRASALAFNEEATLFAIGTREGLVHVYSVEGPRLVATLDPRTVPCNAGELAGSVQEGASDNVSGLSFDPADPDLLLVTGSDGRLCLRNLAKPRGQPLAGLPARPVRALHAPDGARIAIGTGDGRVWIWDRELAQYLPQPLHAGEGTLRDLDFHPQDPDLLVTATNEGDVAIWDLQPALSRDLADESLPAPAAPEPGTLASAAGVSLVAVDGGYAIRAAGDGVRTGPLQLPENIARPASVALSPDGSWLAWAPPRGRLLLFALARSLRPITDLGGPEDAWTAVGFAAEPDRVVAESATGAIRSWRYFETPAELVAYGEAVLPKTLEGPALALSELELKLLRGEFGLFPDPPPEP